MCHLDFNFPSVPYICPFFSENHIWLHLCVSHPIYFEAYHTYDFAGSLAVGNFLL